MDAERGDRFRQADFSLLIRSPSSKPLVDNFLFADNTAECAGGFYAHRGFCAPLTAETQVSLYKG
jgi:hypothetical protein